MLKPHTLSNFSTSVKNKLGAGIYTPSDISRLLNIPASKVRRVIHEYWDGLFASKTGNSYSWRSSRDDQAVPFYVLIELYTFYQLKEKNVSTQKILKAHQAMEKDLETEFPFATSSLLTNGKKIWYRVHEDVIDADGTRQSNFVRIIEDFADKIDFNSKHLAERFFPMGKNSAVVVDPHHQFGLPVVNGTNINTETVYQMLRSGEPESMVMHLYDLSAEQLSDVLKFYSSGD